jgi:hypothetical protein
VHQAPVTALCPTPDSEHLVSGSQDGSVVISELYTSSEVWRTRHKSAVSCLAVPPDPCEHVREIAVGTEGGVLAVKRKVRLPCEECALHNTTLQLARPAAAEYSGPDTLPLHQPTASTSLLHQPTAPVYSLRACELLCLRAYTPTQHVGNSSAERADLGWCF